VRADVFIEDGGCKQVCPTIDVDGGSSEIFNFSPPSAAQKFPTSFTVNAGGDGPTAQLTSLCVMEKKCQQQISPYIDLVNSDII